MTAVADEANAGQGRFERRLSRLEAAFEAQRQEFRDSRIELTRRLDRQDEWFVQLGTKLDNSARRIHGRIDRIVWAGLLAVIALLVGLLAYLLVHGAPWQ